jgi:hypothetical protein
VKNKGQIIEWLKERKHQSDKQPFYYLSFVCHFVVFFLLAILLSVLCFSLCCFLSFSHSKENNKVTNKGQIIEWLKERKHQSDKQRTDNRMAKRKKTPK